jgi:hypothetical protein
MKIITGKLIKVVFILKIVAWMFVTTLGLVSGAFMTKKDTECPYSPVDGNSKSIRALNYR